MFPNIAYKNHIWLSEYTLWQWKNIDDDRSAIIMAKTDDCPGIRYIDCEIQK